jgi:hypothetical protein
MGFFPRNDRYFEIFEDAAKEGEEVASAFRPLGGRSTWASP